LFFSQSKQATPVQANEHVAPVRVFAFDIHLLDPATR